MATGMRAEKVAEWQERLDRFERSGTSIAEFCRDEGVSAPSFYAWRRKLGRKPNAAGSIGARRFAGRSAGTAQTVPGQPRQGSFVPVRVLGEVNLGGPPTLIAELRGGTRLTIPMVDPEALQLAIAALVRADAERVGDRPC